MQIVHGGKLSRLQNQIQFAGKHSWLTVRSSLMAPAKLNPKIYGHRQTTIKACTCMHVALLNVEMTEEEFETECSAAYFAMVAF